MQRSSNSYAALVIAGWLCFLALLASVAAHADTVNLGNATISKANGGTAATTGAGAAATLSLPYIICQGGAGGWSTTSSSEHALAVCTIPANTLGAGGAWRVRVLWSMSNTTNAKTLTVRYGSSGCTVGSACSSGTSILADGINASGVQVARCTLTVWNRNATGSQVTGAGAANCNNASSGSGGGAPVTLAIDTTAASYINIDGTTNGTDTITLEAYTVEVLPAGGN